MTPLRVFIGYDEREAVAYHVLTHSILRRASVPVSITPLVQPALRACGLYTRPRTDTESTAFSLTRFLVPYLAGYTGWALFLDCDMLCREDLAFLWAEAEKQPDASVLVAQHDYTPSTTRKFLGQVQAAYPRKNWSSVMLFNAARCQSLTPQYVNQATGLELHRFAWLPDSQIGSLPLDWNWLVGEYPPNSIARLWHYTLGGPWFHEFRDCDHAAEWMAEYMLGTCLA